MRQGKHGREARQKRLRRGNHGREARQKRLRQENHGREARQKRLRRAPRRYGISTFTSKNLLASRTGVPCLSLTPPNRNARMVRRLTQVADSPPYP